MEVGRSYGVGPRSGPFRSIPAFLDAVLATYEHIQRLSDAT